MVPFTWFQCIVIVFLYPTNICSEISKNFCKTVNGDTGRCIESRKCPQVKSNSSITKCTINGKEDFVCCPAMERIVTPNVAPSPVPTSSPLVTSVTPFPVVESTTKIVSPVVPPKRISEVKCEQYKHRVKKRASIITYVFGGSASLSIKEFPHMAILGYGHAQQVEWLCGGSLISEQFVLTAAHCLVNSDNNELVRVRLGDLDLQSVVDDSRPEDFGITETIVHPNYRPPSEYNDIALIKLDRQVQFSDYIAPICLETSNNLPNMNFIATGWGKTELGGVSDILMKVDLVHFPHDECAKNFADVSPENLPQGIEDKTQICAGSYTEEKDTCQGDSGGPLQIKDDTLYVVGITSFGKECGIPGSPGVYTKVSYYVPWIEEIVWPQ